MTETIPGSHAAYIDQHKAQCEARRERVLAHPDIAAKLTRPPIGYSSPAVWNGYIPPAETGGGLTGSQTNTSVVRKALIAICHEVVEREKALAAGAEPPRPREIDDQPGTITQLQLTKLQILLRECELYTRSDRLAYCQSVVDREVETTKELSKREAMRLIDALERIQPEIHGGTREPEPDDPTPTHPGPVGEDPAPAEPEPGEPPY